MGVTPCTDSITIAFGCQFRVDRRESSLAVILIAFGKLMPEILRDFIQQVALGFGERAMGQSRKPFFCDRCGNDKEFVRKTRHGKETRILTVFQWVRLQQLPVQCKRCGHKFNITRKLLGIDVGNYNGGWKKLFENSIETLKGFRRFLLIAGDDTSILEGLKGKVKILIQRCLP